MSESNYGENATNKADRKIKPEQERSFIMINLVKFEFSIAPTSSVFGLSIEFNESSIVYYRYEIALLLGLFKRKLKLSIHFWRF